MFTRLVGTCSPRNTKYSGWLDVVLLKKVLVLEDTSEEGIIQPLSSRSLKHRISLYADDVVIFLRPTRSDIEVTIDILILFGEASGLKANVQKSNVLPIQYSSILT